MAEKGKVGLVLAGGGARGAYEAGVLSELLPELERRGERPQVIVGTSVGAINAAFLGATSHLEAECLTARWRKRWLELAPERVIRPILRHQAPRTVLRYAAEVVGIPGVRLQALLDPTPLGRTLDRWVDWRRLHRNVRSGAVDAVAVAATSALRARSVVFVEGRSQEQLRDSQAIDYVSARLGVDLVRASAAIPTLFPAVWIEQPKSVRGWYFDGGTRLNTPIKPALDLGVDRLVVVATHAADARSHANWHDQGTPPDFADGAIQLLFATLVDSLIEDVRMLGKINLLAGRGGVLEEARRYKEARGRLPYREIPYMFIAPRARDAIGDAAAEVFHRHYGGVRGLRSPDIALLSRLVGGMTEPHGELLSYLFFTPEFAEALIEMGRRDARSWLDRDWGPEGPWYSAPVDTLPEFERTAAGRGASRATSRPR